MATEKWVELDEDNNKPDPKCGLFCIRCKRPIKQIKGSLPTMVRKSITGKHLIGSECWKKINC